MWSRPPQDTRRPGRLPFSSATKAPGPGVGGCVPSFPLSCVFSQDHSHSLFPPGAQGSPRGDFFAGLVGPLQSPLQPASRGNRVPLGSLQACPVHSPLGQGCPLRRGTWAGRGECRESEEPTRIPSLPRPGCAHSSEVLIAIHIHDLLAHVLSLLRINMKPFFRMKFHGFIFPPVLVTRLKMAIQ